MNTQAEMRWDTRIVGLLKKQPNWLWCSWLCLLALIIRILAADKVFPAQGDVSHFVQYGKVFAATGKLESLSSLWSLAPQFLVAWSMKLGWMPQIVMQTTGIAFGVLAVTGVCALAMELTRSRRVALVAGLTIATNPVLTSLAVAGFSDTPHFALGTWTLTLAFAGARRQKAWLFALSAVLASLDLYFRTYDLFLYLVSAAPFILWRLRGGGLLRGLKLIGTALVVGIVCSLPFFFINSAISGWNPGHSKLGNLALGASGTNAKELYAQYGLGSDQTPLAMRVKELEDNGIIQYMWAHKADIARRYPVNVAGYVRVLNDHVFTGMFRMGLFWFLLFLVLCAKSLRGTVGGYMILSIGVVSGALSVGFVNPRWIIQCVPFCAILAGGGFNWLLSRFSSRRMCWLAWGVMLAFACLNARWAVVKLNDEWKQKNLFPVCERLHEIMTEDERLMCFRPELPALFYQTNALCWDNIPYGPVESVFALAEAHGTDCIVLNDSVFQHFPIHEIERNPDLIPAPWHEVDCLCFEEETRFELEHDVWRFYRKDEQGKVLGSNYTLIPDF